MNEQNPEIKKKRTVSSLNPQGLTEDEKDHSPKSVLEDRAKKKNTKI
ncbi:small, acid-soluble spore protein L [Aciduricibacillus chroicocephali]|uniref:Small, acid-soluble spore protein L n=1 Tax=Aciduricibacillus chroicocephali TaxID=3054939 RepID=A0ABY9KXM0_9BACI|nr:small, acid-soluble spore protein L [Bacillaceae bacterium 44XB]